MTAVLPPAPIASPAPLPVERPAVEALRMFVRNPAAIVGMALLLAIVLVATVGPLVEAADPFEIRAAPLTPPFGADAWLGSDYLGRDVLTMLVYGGRATLLVGAVAALLSVVIGIAVGALRGLLRRRGRRGADAADRVLPGAAGASLRDGHRHPVRADPGARHRRHRHRQLDLDRAPHSRRIPEDQGARIRARRARHRRPQCAHHLARDPAQRAAAADRRGLAYDRRRILSEAGLSFLGLGDPNT